jgi:hypothetical protein
MPLIYASNNHFDNFCRKTNLIYTFLLVIQSIFIGNLKIALQALILFL